MRPAAIWRGAGAAATSAFWLAFPVVPVLAGNFAHELGTLRGTIDPYDWEADQWWFLAGPLFGYGFLAGATWGVADEPGGRWWRSWVTRRAAWVGLGPWLGLWVAAAAGLTLGAARWALGRAGVSWPAGWEAGPSGGIGVAWMAGVAGVGWLAFGWVALAWAALRRSRRAGRLGRSWGAGLGLGSAFVGSLFGAFWIVTTAWRDYFFDPTIAP